MEDEEYERIEAEALRIVDTLKKLKEEIEGYRHARIDTQESLKSLDGLIDEIASAGGLLKATAEEIRKSDYTALYHELSSQSAQLDDAYGKFVLTAEGLYAVIDQKLSGQAAEQAKEYDELKEAIHAKAERDDEEREALVKRVETLESVIARIDRNTQKGFGKERG